MSEPGLGEPAAGAGEAEPGREASRLGPRRLHPAGALLAGVRVVRELLLAALLGSGYALVGEGLSPAYAAIALAAVVAVLAVAGVAGYLSWRATTYAVAGGAIVLRRGVLGRQETSVPVERVSAVDTEQGPVQRLFGVVELRIQAAGGGKAPEIRLSALTTTAAEELRAALASAAPRTAPELDERAEPIRRLGGRALVVAALTSGQIGFAVPIVAGALQYVDDFAQGYAETLVDAVAASASVALAALLVVLVAAWSLSILGTVIAFSGFSVTRGGDRLLVERGFLRRRVTTIPIARVQAVRVVEGVLRQPFGLAQLRVESAGYAAEAAVNTTLFPLIRRGDVPGFLADAVPELAGTLGPLGRPPPRSLLRFAALPALACLIAAATLAARPGGAPAIGSGAALALAALALGHALLRYRAAGWRLEDGRLVARSRLLARTTVVAAADRLQTRTLVEGPLERALGLATFAFALASRARFRIAHLDTASGRRLLAALRSPG